MNHPAPPPAPFAATGLAADLDTLSREFAASAARYDRTGEFPHENFRRLHEAGLLALPAPTPHGAGAGLAQARRVIEAVARGEPATALVLTMTYLNLRHLARADNRWPAAVRERVLASAAAEGALINALRVEPRQGSPSRGGLPDTVARRHGAGWRLSGRKAYTTGIPALRWLLVWARTDEDQPRTGVFLVERGPATAERIRVVETWDHMGLRASGSHDVVLDEVDLPYEHAVDLRAPAEWASHGGATDLGAHDEQQAWMIVLLGTLYDAVAQSAHAWLLDFLRERSPGSLGAPLATLPRVQESVGEIAALLRTNRILLDEAARAADTGSPAPASDSGLLKFTVTGNAIAAVEHALRLAGNHGLSRHNPLERHYRDVLCSRIHTPQNDAILIAAGRRALQEGAATAGAGVR